MEPQKKEAAPNNHERDGQKISKAKIYFLPQKDIGNALLNLKNARNLSKTLRHFRGIGTRLAQKEATAAEQDFVDMLSDSASKLLFADFNNMHVLNDVRSIIDTYGHLDHEPELIDQAHALLGKMERQYIATITAVLSYKQFLSYKYQQDEQDKDVS